MAKSAILLVSIFLLAGCTEDNPLPWVDGGPDSGVGSDGASDTRAGDMVAPDGAPTVDGDMTAKDLSTSDGDLAAADTGAGDGKGAEASQPGPDMGLDAGADGTPGMDGTAVLPDAPDVGQKQD